MWSSCAITWWAWKVAASPEACRSAGSLPTARPLDSESRALLETSHEATLRNPRPPITPFRLTRADFLSGPASFLPPAFALGLALMLLFSPHYAWYIAWLFPFFALMPSLPMATYLMCFFYGYTTYLADPGPKMFLLNERLYAVTLLAFLVFLALKAWRPFRENFLATRFFPPSGPYPSNLYTDPPHQETPA